MEQDTLHSTRMPARLKKVQLPIEDRQEIIDYFVCKAMAFSRFSYEGSQIETIVHLLRSSDDPIGDILDSIRRHSRLYTEAMEMLYAVRHRVEDREAGACMSDVFESISLSGIANFIEHDAFMLRSDLVAYSVLRHPRNRDDVLMRIKALREALTEAEQQIQNTETSLQNLRK